MRPARCRPLIILAIAAMLSSTLSAHAATPVPARFFTVVNASFDSVTALAFAPAGSGAYEDAALGAPLQGGVSDATVKVPGGDCLRDIRATFRNGDTQVFPAIDVCRRHRMRLSPGRAGVG